MKKQLITALLLTSMSQVAFADARKNLDNFFTKVASMKGNFTQRAFNKKGQVTQNSSGLLYLSRPGKFRWVYKAPDPQEIIGDGRNVWVWDKDLDQVTVKAANQAISNTPISILTRRDPPGARFHIKALPKKGGVDWFQLIPKKASRDFRRIDLGLDARGNLRNMTMYDQLGQRTEISLNTQNNVPIPGKTFYFEPPKGADVIGKAR
jgi:outer membrane lipoprotein carrier protein